MADPKAKNMSKNMKKLTLKELKLWHLHKLGGDWKHDVELNALQVIGASEKIAWKL